MSWLSLTVAQRTAGAAVAVTMVVLAPTPASLAAPALAAQPVRLASGPFGLTPSAAASGQPRSYFDFAVAPGGTVRDTVIISNEARQAQRLRLAVSKGVTAANSGSAFEDLAHRCPGPSCWISGLPRTVVLAPRTRRALAFTITVPRQTRQGQYLSGITVMSAKRPRAVSVGSSGHASARAIIIDQVTVGVAVTVGRLSRLLTGLRIGAVRAGWIGIMPRLSIPVLDTGQTFVRATGRIGCRSGGRRHSYRVIMETVLPGGRAVLPVNARGLTTGRLPCVVGLRTSSGRAVSWTGTVGVPARTPTTTYHPTKGVYVSLPVQTIPPWAIALMVLGGLILIALMTILGQRHRRLRARPSTTTR